MWEKRMERLFCILSYLSPHSKVTTADLAKEYEVNRRTIERDIQILSNARLGVSYDPDGYICISRTGYRKIRSWMLS